MDQQGRIFLPDGLRHRLGLNGKMAVEFAIDEDGAVFIRKAQLSKPGTSPK